MITWSLHSWVDSIFRGRCCHRCVWNFHPWCMWTGVDGVETIALAIYMKLCRCVALSFESLSFAYLHRIIGNITMCPQLHWIQSAAVSETMALLLIVAEWATEWVSEFSGVEAAEASSDRATDTEKKDNGEMDSYAMMIQYMTWSMSFGGGALSFY